LQLEQLQQPGSFAGGSHHAQLTSRIRQQQPGGGDVQQLDAAVGQHVQEVDHVEAGDQGVGQLDERRRQYLSVYPRSPFQDKAARSSGCAASGARAADCRIFHA
jgi:hypothetical protein